MSSIRKNTVGFIIGFASLATAPAFAGNLNLDFRFDLDNVSYNDDHASKGKNSSDFKVQTGRLDYRGKFGEDVTYRLRARFNRNDPTLRKDNLSPEVDYAYLTHKTSDLLSVTVGKYASELGGWDGVQAGADVYLASSNYAAIVNGNTYNRAKNNLSGLKTTFNFEGQEVSLMAANFTEQAASPTTAQATVPQTRMLVGAVYKGSFLDKTLSPNVSYAVESPNDGTGSGAADKDAKWTFTNVGLKYELPEWLVTLDQGILAHTKQTISAVSSKVDQSSTVLNAAYKFDTMSVKLMYDMTTRKTAADAGGTDAKVTINGLGLGFEYRPNNDKNFRYHIAYTNQTQKGDGITGTPAESHIIIGARLFADFLTN